MTRRARRLVAELRAMLDGPNDADLARMVEDAKRQAAVLSIRSGIAWGDGWRVSCSQATHARMYSWMVDGKPDWRALEVLLYAKGWRDGELREQLAELRELSASLCHAPPSTSQSSSPKRAWRRLACPGAAVMTP